MSSCGPIRNLTFNRQVWIDDSSLGHRARGEMLDDLIKHKLVRGLHQEVVDSLLGPPDYILDREGVQRLWGGSALETYAYPFNVGYPQLYTEDTNLYIGFDSNHQITRVEAFYN